MALKAAIQVHFQLEDNELAAEPLPDELERRSILFFEASEGGAGVLRRLVDEPAALQAVARLALEIAHFDPDTGRDLGRAPRSRETCEAACYDCLLSYYNQRDHELLDRKLLPELLRPWLTARLQSSPTTRSRQDELQGLLNLCGSELERDWLRMVERLALRLPVAAQQVVENCQACPDFTYPQAYVFVDGPHHDSPDKMREDGEVERRLEEHRIVIRFHHGAEWRDIFRRYPGVFGEIRGDTENAQ